MADIEDSEVKAFYSSESAGGFNYLGGPRSTTEISDNILYNLFPKTTDDEQHTGVIKYRCFYFYNGNTTTYIKNPAVFVVSDTTSSNDFVEVTWGTSEIGDGVFGSTDDSIEQTIADQFTSPVDAEANPLQFFRGNTRSGGAILNQDIPPRKGKAAWVKYTSLFNAPDFPYDTFKLRFVADNLESTAIIRRNQTLPDQITFTVMGNCSSDSDFVKLAGFMLPTNPHFIVTTGNNNMDSNPGFFITVMGASNMSKMLLALGPANTTDPTVMNAYLNELAKYPFVSNPQRTYYSKTFGNVHVLVMNTSGNVPYTNPSAQYDFVLTDLRAANTNPNIDWIFVVTNRPVYGSIVTSQLPPEETPTAPPTHIPRPYYIDIAKTYHQIFASNGVLAVFQGQINFFERSKPLKYNPASPIAPQAQEFDGPANFTLSGRKNLLDSVIWITIGNGGFVHDLSNSLASYNEGYNSVDFGYVRITIENRLDTPKVILRHYLTSNNIQIFSTQATFTRTS